jgi:hypothetical protein
MLYILELCLNILNSGQLLKLMAVSRNLDSENMRTSGNRKDPMKVVWKHRRE